jgi:hypothetical protein
VQTSLFLHPQIRFVVFLKRHHIVCLSCKILLPFTASPLPHATLLVVLIAQVASYLDHLSLRVSDGDSSCDSPPHPSALRSPCDLWTWTTFAIFLVIVQPLHTSFISWCTCFLFCSLPFHRHSLRAYLLSAAHIAVGYVHLFFASLSPRFPPRNSSSLYPPSHLFIPRLTRVVACSFRHVLRFFTSQAFKETSSRSRMQNVESKCRN